MKNRNILFFGTNDSNRCSVSALWNMLRNRITVLLPFTGKYNYILMQNRYENYTEFIKQKKLSDSNHIVVFGYIDANNKSILCFSNGCQISADWFNKKSEESVHVFFISHGASLLKDPMWNSNIKKWVSFNDEYDDLRGLKISEDELKIIYREVFDTIYRHSETKKLKNAIHDLFHASFLRVSTKYKKTPDSVVTNIKLLHNKRILACD